MGMNPHVLVHLSTGTLTAEEGALFWLLLVESWLLCTFCGERKSVIPAPLPMEARVPSDI